MNGGGTTLSVDILTRWKWFHQGRGWVKYLIHRDNERVIPWNSI